MALIIRHPTPEEDLSPFFDVERCPLKWNCAQVYVADDGTRLVGLAIIFDGGHDVVMLDYVRVLPPWEGKGLWIRLTRHILVALRAQGKTLAMGYGYPEQVAGMVRLLGGTEGPERYRIFWKGLTDGP